MKCAKCGKEIQDDAHFCAYCGGQVLPESVPFRERIRSRLKRMEKEDQYLLAEMKKETLRQRLAIPQIEPDLPETSTLEGIEMEFGRSADSLLDVIAQKIAGGWKQLTKFGKISLLLYASGALLLFWGMTHQKVWTIVFAMIQLGIAGVATLMHSSMMELTPEHKYIPYLVQGMVLPILVLNLLSFTWQSGPAKPAPGPEPSPVATEVPAGTQVSAPYTSQELLGQPRDYTEEMFRAAGFQTVRMEPVETLAYVSAEWLGLVESVTIDNTVNYSTERLFDPSAEVVIHYYTFGSVPFNFHVEFEENKFFNRYGVTAYLDGIELGSLEHGQDGSFSTSIKPGQHVLKFMKIDGETAGETTLDLKGQTDAQLRISCAAGKVKIQTLYLADRGLLDENHVMLPDSLFTVAVSDPQAAAQALSDAGFVNLMLQPMYDVTAQDAALGRIAAISIDGRTDLHQGEIFSTEAVIIIQYHEDEEKNPASIQAQKEQAALEIVFPREMARRAVITAMTNGRATDVFLEDGVTYDPAAFHSYSDLSGFFLHMEDEGVWSAAGEKTWHVDNMILKIYEYDFFMRVSADITRNGDKYVLAPAERTIAEKKNLYSTDPGVADYQKLEPSDRTPWLIVPETLILADRDAVQAQQKANEKDARQKWIRDQFSSWPGEHIELSRQIKATLEDPDTFRHEKVSYIDVTDAVQLRRVNQILAEAGVTQQAVIGDLLVMESFEAENLFDVATSSIGIGLVSRDGTAQLLTIQTP